MLNFDDLRQANTARCEESFHPINEWSPSDWATAMAGECGEACNIIKKLRRNEDGRQISNLTKDDLGKELADVICYVDLLAARMQINLGQAVIDKFNEVSTRVGSYIKL